MKKSKSKPRPAKPILYPAEFLPQKGSATSRDLRDADYLSKLSVSDRAWYAKFQTEYYLGVFGESPVHKTAEQRRSVYRAQNSRRRCLQPTHLIYKGSSED